MKFSEFKLQDAEGIVLAHTLRLDSKTIKKGYRLSRMDIEHLRQSGLESIIGARLETDDIDEDSAALRLAKSLVGSHLIVGKAMAGRVNLHAAVDGVAMVDKQRVDAINSEQSAITIATLPNYADTMSQQAVATVKVIPFAVAAELLEQCVGLAQPGRQSSEVIELRPYKSHKIGLILTRTPGLKASVLESTRNVTRHRLQAMGNDIACEECCDHTHTDIQRGICKMLDDDCRLILICGASVTVDRGDIIPAVMARLGGEIEHFGMPVEPGNMLLLGRIGACRIIVLPGCSRSPKLNGLDWVLQRHLADIVVNKKMLQAMGVGGLIKDLPLLERRRKAVMTTKASKVKSQVAAVVLAAGLSQRAGKHNKLLFGFKQTTMINQIIQTLTRSSIGHIIVVTGHEAQRIEQALEGFALELVFNSEYKTGMASSIRAGLNGLDESIDAAMIVLADMPLLSVDQINDLVAEFDPCAERNIVAPFKDGKRGNPVLWARDYFPAMKVLRGDQGAKGLLAEFSGHIWDVPMADDAIFTDFDTLESLAKWDQNSE